MFSIFRKKTPVSSLKADKEAIVQGEVVAREEMSLPNSGTKCVFYEKMNESFIQGARGRGRRMWVPQNMEKRFVGFFVRDASGKVWVAADTDAIDVQGGKQESGFLGKGQKKRYFAKLIISGDKVVVRGVASEPKAAEPADCMVIRPDAKGRIVVKIG